MQLTSSSLIIFICVTLCLISLSAASAPQRPSLTISNSIASARSPITITKRKRTTPQNMASSKTVTAGYMMKMPPLADKRSIAEQLCQTCSGPIYSQGLETFQVPMALYEVNRARVVQSMLEQDSSMKGLILLEGGKQTTRYDTDHEPVFRQESYFHYLFGASQYSDCYGVLSLPEGEATLFVPTWGIDTETVCGPSPEFERVKKELGVERVFGVGELKTFVEKEMKRLGGDSEGVASNVEVNGGEQEEKKSGDKSASESTPKLFLLKGMNTDSGNFASPAHFGGIEKYKDVRDEDTLFKCIAECRVTKSPAEINLLRYTNWISSMAHVEVMRACKPGMMEYQLESLFQHHTYTHGGCRHMSYTCICACGPNANILHYGHAGRPNARQLKSTDIALLDMGAEYHCYASDITCSFPVSGTFTDDQLSVYESVLAAQVSIMRELKPGVSWVEMHREAERKILKGLVKCGLLITAGIDDTAKAIEEMLDADLGAIFMPHGMGHLIGIDTHDVGGYAAGTPERSARPGLRKLRTARIMEEGMVLTVEPGCYFIDPLLDMALSNDKQKKFFNTDRLKDFRGFGGVRLEDDVRITADGCENLTLCPRAASEVVDVMKGGAWPPEKDVMPELKRAWVVCKEGKMETLHM